MFGQERPRPTVQLECINGNKGLDETTEDLLFDDNSGLFVIISP